MKRILVAFALVLLSVAPAPADDVRSKPLTLHPPASAAPALQYALLPELQDLTPGNAADHYRQAIKNLKKDAPPETDWYPALGQWMTVPLKELRGDEVSRFLKQCDSTFKEVDAGARCEGCDWGMAEELRRKGFAAPEPDLQSLQAIGRLLDLRVRYALAEGRMNEVIRTLQSGFAMARHVADAPNLLNAPWGMEISGWMLDRLEEVIQQPGAPSFYWPLADLPRPLFDMRKPMQGERVLAYGSFPGLAEMAADLNAKPWTPEQVEKSMSMVRSISLENSKILDLYDRSEILLHIAARHEADKQSLIEEGRPKELVDAMPHVQVALLVAMRHFDRVFDELQKEQSLPFWEAQPAMTPDVQRRLTRKWPDDRDAPAIPIAWVFVPQVDKVFAMRTRIDRRIAALRCVEAVRLYAAAHDGKPPASLDDVKDEPVPDDPVTGKPFGYRIAGDRAYLSSLPFPDQPATTANTPTYELIFNK